MGENQVLSAILKRRSRRNYTAEPISDETISAILDAARWAPSGLNNQPWKFSVIKNRAKKEELSGCTRYKDIVTSCETCIAVFYHVPSGYNRDKDLMGIGACIQNMLLAAESLNIGAVWLGEIINRKEEVRGILCVDSENELMAVIALGHSDEKPQSDRKEIESLMLKCCY